MILDSSPENRAEVEWVPEHMDVGGNERSDVKEKEGTPWKGTFSRSHAWAYRSIKDKVLAR